MDYTERKYNELLEKKFDLAHSATEMARWLQCGFDSFRVDGTNHQLNPHATVSTPIGVFEFSVLYREGHVQIYQDQEKPIFSGYLVDEDGLETYNIEKVIKCRSDICNLVRKAITEAME